MSCSSLNFACFFNVGEILEGEGFGIVLSELVFRENCTAAEKQ